jgi:hypothetical protein
LAIEHGLKRHDRSQSAHQALRLSPLSHELDADERDNAHAGDARTVPRITVCRIARRYRSQRNLALFESKNLAADQLEETMACNFPKRADKTGWTDRELRLEELEAVSGGTPAKHQQPHESVKVQLKEVFIS